MRRCGVVTRGRTIQGTPFWAKAFQCTITTDGGQPTLMNESTCTTTAKDAENKPCIRCDATATTSVKLVLILLRWNLYPRLLLLLRGPSFVDLRSWTFAPSMSLTPPSKECTNEVLRGVHERKLVHERSLGYSNINHKKKTINLETNSAPNNNQTSSCHLLAMQSIWCWLLEPNLSWQRT